MSVSEPLWVTNSPAGTDGALRAIRLVSGWGCSRSLRQRGDDGGRGDEDDNAGKE